MEVGHTARKRAARAGALGQTSHNHDDSLKILSKKKFDALKLKEEIDGYRPKQLPGYSKDATAVGDFITHVMDDLVWNQIHDATGRISGSFVERVVSEAHEDWAHKEWNSAKVHLMDSLGHRSQKWKNSQSLQRQGQLQGHVHGEVGGDAGAVADCREQSTLVRGRVTGSGAGVATHPGSSSSSSSSSNSSSSSSSSSSSESGKISGSSGTTGTSADAGTVALRNRPDPAAYGVAMTAFAREHAEVVRSVSLHRQQQQAEAAQTIRGTSTVLRPASAFLNAIHDVMRSGVSTEADNLSRKDLEGYGDVMQHLAEIVGEYKKIPRSPGSLSSVCYGRQQTRQPQGQQIHQSGISQWEREATVVHAKVMRRARLELTMGSKLHLENQMRMLWEDFVDHAVHGGRMALHPLVQGEGESSRQKVRTYVRIRDQTSPAAQGEHPEVNPVKIRSPRDNGATPVWPFVYHCLRVGDLDGAVAELQACKHAGLHVESEIIVALRLFSQILKTLQSQTAADRSFEESDKQSQLLTTLEANDLKGALNACQQLYFAEDQQQNPARKCYYRLFVLNVISLSDIDLFSAVPEEDGEPEIEHYLWGSLWYIQWNGVLKMCGFDSLPDDVPDNGELDLYTNILGFGGEQYFEAPSGDAADATFEPFSPYVYAKVLICCQRFGDAINYLWRNGQIFPSIHLAVVCLHYGLILPHKPLTENPAYQHATPASNTSTSYGNPEPANILRVYTSAPFLLDYPEQTVDYMMCLHTEWKQGVAALRERISPEQLFWETENVAAETRLSNEFTHLFTSMGKSQLRAVCGEVRMDIPQAAGTSPVSNGSTSTATRSSGYIDRHISHPELVNNLLSTAAHHLLSLERDAEGAIFLYQLAGHYADVVHEMINQLGMVMMPPHSDRNHWLHMCSSFYETYIVRGLGPVAQTLQKSHLTHLSKALGDVLALCSFHDLHSAGKWDEAVKVLDATELLPRELSDVSRYATLHSTQNLNPTIRKSTDDVLLCCMECSRCLYVRHKNECTSANDNVMTQLRNRAQTLVRYSIAISSSLRPDTPQRLSQIESTLF